MNTSNKSEEYFNMLLKNFRFSEALGYISSLIDMDQLSTERGKACEHLIRAYKRVVCNSLWNSEGLFLLKVDEINLDLPKDLADEKKRLLNAIEKNIENKRFLLLLYVSAYYAIANEDSLHLKNNLDKIKKEIFNGKESIGLSEAIGGYEEFQVIGNELEKYYGLETPILKVMEEFSIKIRLLTK